MALEYGVVAGRYRSTIADTPDDADDLPQLEPLVGTIIFDPRPEVILVDNTAAEGSMTITPMPTRVQLGPNGDLSHNGKPYVKLLSPESSSIDTHDWTYEVSFDLRTLDGQPVRMSSFDIFVKASDTVLRPLDLTTATPVIRNTGTQTIVGPSNVLTIGKVVSGAAAQAIITGTSPEQVLDLVLPRGETGLTPKISIGEVITTPNPSDDDWLAPIIKNGPLTQQAMRDAFPSTMKGDKGDAGGWGNGGFTDPAPDLNTLKTPGLYSNNSTASLAKNYPAEGLSGRTMVYMIANQPHLIQQEWHPNPHTQIFDRWARGYYVRMLNTQTWSPWRFIATQRVDNTAGRAIYTWDDTANREQMIYGDTGSRNLNSLLINGWVPGPTALTIRRMNNIVYLNGIVDGTSFTVDQFVDLGEHMANFVPSTSAISGVVVSGDYAQMREILRQNNMLYVRAGVKAVWKMNVSWATNAPWPTSLPGIPA